MAPYFFARGEEKIGRIGRIGTNGIDGIDGIDGKFPIKRSVTHQAKRYPSSEAPPFIPSSEALPIKKFVVRRVPSATLGKNATDG